MPVISIRVRIASIACVLLAPTASAQDLASLELATNLGSVLASEGPCNLQFDQAAISGFIDDNVAADDMSFPSTLQMMTAGSAVQLNDMTESQKTAHCTQIERIARSYGFIAD